MVRSFLHLTRYAKEVNHLLIASETISTEDIWGSLSLKAISSGSMRSFVLSDSAPSPTAQALAARYAGSP